MLLLSICPIYPSIYPSMCPSKYPSINPSMYPSIYLSMSPKEFLRVSMSPSMNPRNFIGIPMRAIIAVLAVGSLARPAS